MTPTLMSPRIETDMFAIVATSTPPTAPNLSDATTVTAVENAKLDAVDKKVAKKKPRKWSFEDYFVAMYPSALATLSPEFFYRAVVIRRTIDNFQGDACINPVAVARYLGVTAASLRRWLMPTPGKSQGQLSTEMVLRSNPITGELDYETRVEEDPNGEYLRWRLDLREVLTAVPKDGGTPDQFERNRWGDRLLFVDQHGKTRVAHWVRVPWMWIWDIPETTTDPTNEWQNSGRSALAIFGGAVAMCEAKGRTGFRRGGKYLAEGYKVSQRTMLSALTEAEDAGLILVFDRGGMRHSALRKPQIFPVKETTSQTRLKSTGKEK